MLPTGAGAFEELPPLSCGAIYGAAAIAADKTHSALGQVLLIGGRDQEHTATSSVRLVDLATGVCTQQAALLNARSYFAAARLTDGGIICAGGDGNLSTAEMWGAPVQGALLEVTWTWRGLPAMSVWRSGCSGCTLSDGRFAVLGGYSTSGCTPSCEALTLGDDEHWAPLPSTRDTRAHFTCAAVAGCLIVARGGGCPERKSAEVCDEMLGQWLRLPHDLPSDGGLLGSALL